MSTCSGISRSLVLSALVGMGAGCGAEPDSAVAITESAALGDVLPGIDPGLFAEAKEAFDAVEGITDGVGPIFNERACAACHSEGADGGAGVNIERRFGRFVNGVFDPLANLGGTLRQLFTVANFNNPNLPAASRGRCQTGNPTLCCVPLEVEPPQATIRNVGRLTTPLFGLGLVDAMPDSFFVGLQAAQPAAIRGFVNRVPVILPNPGDPTQSIRSTRVGRFGWKAGVPTLLQFSADAYNNEMAITTQSCFRGTSLNDFALENAPNAPNGSVLDGCDDLAPRQPPAFAAAVGLSAAHGAQVDDAVGSCAGGRTEIQDDVFLFAAFMTALAPPPRDFSDQVAVSRGQPLFTQVGCNGCHVTTTFRTPANPAPIDIGNGEEVIRVPGNFAFNPYSDFLVHDMGALGDRIGNAPPDDPALPGDSLEVTRRMRTAPLWGLRFRNRLLHDGRASDVATAIRAHDGQGAAARNAFNALSSANQHNLVQFVRSL
ncbi:MAG: hypothetical protein H7X95_03695 [Deltaproteobacteria bacterium]|nr:hypothetical protein [Deltaproteobacteria bacterium]